HTRSKRDWSSDVCSSDLVGYVSLELCDLLTSSFGCKTSSLFCSFNHSFPTYDSTSFTFIFDCVPLPVCHTTKGKCSFNSTAITLSPACAIPLDFSSSNNLYSLFAFAALFLSIANPFIFSFGIFSFPIGKFCLLLCVLAPQNLSAGTFISPNVSFSVR